MYLAEPLSKTSILFRNARDPGGWLYACDDGEEILDKAPDRVPAYAPGNNPFLREYSDAGRGATVIGHQNIQNRMSAAVAQPGAVPAAAGWPSDTFLEGRRRKYHNGEAVEIFYQPHAITDGDSFIHFRRADVIATGDIFTTTQYPFIDTKAGGTVQGEIEALDNILDRTVYEHDEEGGTMIIPGHGRVCDEYEVSEYRDMIVIVRDRIQALLKTGAKLEQVKAARPTADFDDRYGANTAPGAPICSSRQYTKPSPQANSFRANAITASATARGSSTITACEAPRTSTTVTRPAPNSFTSSSAVARGL